MLRACRYMWTRMHTAGPWRSCCGTLSTTAITTASLGLEAAEHSWVVLHQHGGRSSAPGNRLPSKRDYSSQARELFPPKGGSTAGAGFSHLLGWNRALPSPIASRLPPCSTWEAEPVLPLTWHAAAVEQIDVASPSDLAGLPDSCTAPSENSGAMQIWGCLWREGIAASNFRWVPWQSPQSPHAFAWSVLQREG